jgi:hypothetical protein
MLPGIFGKDMPLLHLGEGRVIVHQEVPERYCLGHIVEYGLVFGRRVDDEPARPPGSPEDGSISGETKGIATNPRNLNCYRPEWCFGLVLVDEVLGELVQDAADSDLKLFRSREQADGISADVRNRGIAQRKLVPIVLVFLCCKRSLEGSKDLGLFSQSSRIHGSGIAGEEMDKRREQVDQVRFLPRCCCDAINKVENCGDRQKWAL